MRINRVSLTRDTEPVEALSGLCAGFLVALRPQELGRGKLHKVLWRGKRKEAIHLARTYAERNRNFVGRHFWARGYFVSTVGRDEEAIRDYIRSQEKRIHAWSSLHCGDRPPSGGANPWGPAGVPQQPL